MQRPKFARIVRIAALFYVLLPLPGFTTEVNATDWVVEQIGVASSSVRAAEISGYKVIWKTGDGIQLYNALDRSIFLIPGSSDARNARIDGENVVWQAAGRLWLYDGESTQNKLELASLGEQVLLVEYSNDAALIRTGSFTGPHTYHLYNTRDETTRAITSLENAITPHMGGYWVAWAEDNLLECTGHFQYQNTYGRGIFLLDGFSTLHITSYDEVYDPGPGEEDCEYIGWFDMEPRASGSSLVWEGTHSTDEGYVFEVFFWAGNVIQLTDNGVEIEDREPDVSGSKVAWMRRTRNLSDYSVVYYDVATHEEKAVATDLPGYLYPRISGSNITWIVDRRVYLARSDITDSDGDGLLDEWEIAGGIDWDQDTRIDLPLPGADPQRKNLYVEVDTMAAVAPSQQAFDIARETFARAKVTNPGPQGGILIHIQYDGTDAIAWDEDNWPRPPSGDMPAAFIQAEEKHFGTLAERQRLDWETVIKPAKRYVYRHCLFGNRYKDGTADGRSDGHPGANFLVALGPASPTSPKGGTLEEQAGIFLHELGHSLGLRHAGDPNAPVNHDYKPNYFSVMNYLWVKPILAYAEFWYPPDYSRQELRTLDERSLDELVGIGGSSVLRPVPVGPPTPPAPCVQEYGEHFRLVDQAGPVDWNCNGVIEADPVTECWGGPCDLNNLFPSSTWANPSPGQELKGWKDWSNLVYLPIQIIRPASTETLLSSTTDFPEDDDIRGFVQEMGGPGTSLASRVIAPSTLGKGSPGDIFDGTFVGVALANPNKYESDIRINALTPDGQEKALKLELGQVPAQGQKANLTSELVEKPSEASCVMAEGVPPEVKGFFMVGNFSLKRLDGVGGFLRASDELYFPLTRQNDTDKTYLFLFNPSLSSDQVAWLRIFDENGSFEAEKEVRFAGLGTVEGTLDQLFDEPVSLEEGYLEVRAQTPLRGFEFLGGAEAYHALPAQPVYGTERLVAPHFFAARNGGSTLRLLNVGVKDVTAILKGYTDSGEVMGMAEITIGSHKLYKGSVTELLGIDTSNLGTHENIIGYLTVEMTDGTHHLPKVIGALTFQGNDGKWVSTLPLLSRGKNRTLFLHVAQSAEVSMFTGLAILNPGDAEATVTVEVYDEDGNQTGKKEFKIAAGNRVVDVLAGPQFFGSSFQQVKGHIKVLSDLPVMSFALFGHNDQRFMSAIEGQE